MFNDKGCIYDKEGNEIMQIQIDSADDEKELREVLVSFENLFDKFLNDFSQLNLELKGNQFLKYDFILLDRSRRDDSFYLSVTIDRDGVQLYAGKSNDTGEINNCVDLDYAKSINNIDNMYNLEILLKNRIDAFESRLSQKDSLVKNMTARRLTMKQSKGYVYQQPRNIPTKTALRKHTPKKDSVRKRDDSR